MASHPSSNRTGAENDGTSSSSNVHRARRLALFIGGTDFFVPIRDAFLEECHAHNVTCHVVIRQGVCPDDRIQEMKHLMQNFTVQGFCINPCSLHPERYSQFVNETVNAGVPVATYGRDLPQSLRLAFIASSHAKMGRSMARLLRKLKPQGGTYAIVGRIRQERVQAFESEISRYNQYPGRPHWNEVPHDFEPHNRSNVTELYDELVRYAALQPTAIVTLTQSPMRAEKWTQLVANNRNITFIGVDAADFQVQYLEQNYVDGLVAGLPYEIGSSCFRILYDALLPHSEAHHNPNDGPSELPPWKDDESHEVLPFASVRPPGGLWESNLVAYNKVPVELPPLQIDDNMLGNLRYLGWTSAFLLLCAVGYCTTWTVRHRRHVVVKITHPAFAGVILVGVVCLALTLVPLSWEDYGSPPSSSSSSSFTKGYSNPNNSRLLDDRPQTGTVMCMSIPWLGGTGLALVTAALLAKTCAACAADGDRQSISAETYTARRAQFNRYLLSSLVLLLGINWTIMVVWTLTDPLVYVRLEHEGLDYWNRVLATYGACRAEHSLAFLLPLGTVNCVAVLTALVNVLRYQQYSPVQEMQLVGWAAAALLQAFLTGIPLVVIVRDLPRSFYSVLTVTILLLGGSIMGLLFVPKMSWQTCHADMSDTMQWEAVIRGNHSNNRERQVSQNSSSRSGNSSSASFVPRRRSTRGSQSLALVSLVCACTWVHVPLTVHAFPYSYTTGSYTCRGHRRLTRQVLCLTMPVDGRSNGTVEVSKMPPRQGKRLLKWDRMISDLAAFRAEKGHTLVTAQDVEEDPQWAELYKWTVSVRKNYRHQVLALKPRRTAATNPYTKRKFLCEWKIQKLQALGFCWDVQEAAWSRRYDELLRFYQENGNSVVPLDHPGGLGVFVQNCRREYRRLERGEPSTLTVERLHKLFAVDFVWCKSQREAWEHHYKQLQDFHRKYGHANVPEIYADNPALGRWCVRQRTSYTRRCRGEPSSLTEERIQSLEDLGFVWNYPKYRFRSMLKRLSDYFLDKGHIQISTSDPANKDLRLWLTMQRYYYHQRERDLEAGVVSSVPLTQERIHAIETAIPSFSWRQRGVKFTGPSSEDWASLFDEMRKKGIQPGMPMKRHWFDGVNPFSVTVKTTWSEEDLLALWNSQEQDDDEGGGDGGGDDDDGAPAAGGGGGGDVDNTRKRKKRRPGSK